MNKNRDKKNVIQKHLMKNSYLYDMLNFGVELGVIQKKKKHIVKKPQKRRKIRRKYFNKIYPQIPVDCVERKFDF